MKGKRKRYVLLILAFLFLNGCALLGQKQREAVGAFGQATSGTNASPGPVIRELSRLQMGHLTNAAQVASTPDQVATLLTSAADQRTKLLQAAAKVDANVARLQDYSTALTLLVSSDFSEALAPAADAFGNNIGQLTAALQNRANEESSGSAIAEEVENLVIKLGEIYIRYRQLQYLKTATSEAKPAVDSLIQQITESLDGLVVSIDQLKKDLVIDLKALAAENIPSGSRGVFPRAFLEGTANQLYEADLLRQAATDAKAAAEGYKKAHDEMVESVKKGSDFSLSALSDYVEAISSFRESLKAIQAPAVEESGQQAS